MEGEFPVAGSLILLREESDGRAVLLHRESGASVAINPVGVAVWKRLDGRRSAAEIAAGIRDHFSGVPGTASEEIGDFLDQLVELGFVDAEAGRYRWLTGQTEDGGVPGAVHTAEIMITARCNLRCRYCSFFDDPSITYRDLPTGDWLQFFEELGRCGAKVVSLSGGEPFIREDLPQLLDGIVGNGMLFMIGSNGALIDDRIAAHIAATEHCDHVWVSVDGSHAETHDSFRGQGSFEGAIRGIRILQRHGVNTVPRMVIHRRNVRDMEAMARFLLEELHVPLICMTDAYAYGTGRFHAEEMLLTAAERATAMATLFRLREKYNGRIDANHGPLAWGLKWRRMEEARAEGQPAFPGAGYLTGCGCLDDVAVLPDGTMVPCAKLTRMALGRINREPIADVRRHNPLLDRLRRRRSIPLTDFAFCAGCDYVPYCTGNCPSVAFERTGQLDHPSPVGCLRQHLAEGGRVP